MFGWIRTFRTSSVLLPFLTVLCLIFCGSIYYFVWMNDQEEAFDQRAFRKIATISDTLSVDLVLYRSILNLRWQKWSGPVLVDVASNSRMEESFDDFLSTEVPSLHTDCEPVAADTSGAIEIANGQITFRAAKGSGCIQISDLAQDSMSTFPADLFDELLITTASGAVTFQTTRTGLRIADLSTIYPVEHDLVLPQVKSDGSGARIGIATADERSEAPFSRASRHSSRSLLQLGGDSYRVYISPVIYDAGHLELVKPGRSAANAAAAGSQGAPAARSGKAVELYVAGIVSAKRFRQATFTPPQNMTIWALLLMLWVLLGLWPILRIISSDYAERLRPRTVVSVFVLNTAAGCVLALMIAHANDSALDDSTDLKLANLATQVQSNLNAEVGKVIEGSCRGISLLAPGTFLTNGLGSPTNFQDYPYFDHIELDSTNAEQLSKLTLRPHVTPSVRVGDLTFFAAARQDRFWHRVSQSHTQRFRIDPFYSPTTGQYLAIISQPVASLGCNDSAAKLSKFDHPLVFSTISQMITTTDPVMPSDFGFMIVTRTGEVLFHSDASINGRENVLDETGRQPHLQNAVNNGITLHGSFIYHGENTRFYLQPVSIWPESEWRIITFRSMSTVESRHVETMLLSITTICIYILCLMLIIAVCFLMYRGGLIELRPKNEIAGTYLRLAICFPLAFIASLLLSIQGTDLALLLGAFLIPLGMLVFTCGIAKWTLGHAPPVRRWVALLVALAGGAAFLLPFLLRAYERKSDLWAWLLFMAAVTALACIAFGRQCYDALAGKYADTSSGVVSLYAFALTSAAWLLCGIPSLFLYQCSFDYVQYLSKNQELLGEYSSLLARAEATSKNLSVVRFANRRQDETLERVIAAEHRQANRWDQYQAAVTQYDDQREGIPCLLHDHEIDRILFHLFRLNRWLPDIGGATLSALSQGLPVRAGDSSQHSATEDLDGWFSEQTEPREVRIVWKSFTNDPDVLLALKSARFLPPALWAELEPSSTVYFVTGRRLGALLVICLIVYLCTYVNLRFALKRIFAAHSLRVEPWPDFDPGQDTGNCIVIAPSYLLRCPPGVANVGQEVIHFHTGLTSLEVLRIRDRILKLGKENRRLILLCSHLPTEMLSSWEWNQKGLKAESALWNEVLIQFESIRIVRPDFTGSTEKVGCEFDVIWNEATARERITLLQLANDGTVNHNNVAVLASLVKRGVVSADPVPALDPRFSEHLRSGGKLGVLESAHDKERQSTWAGARVIFLILILAITIVLLLFAGQQFLAAIVTAIAPILPLASSFWSRDKGGQKAA